jgi:hypothetical protein
VPPVTTRRRSSRSALQRTHGNASVQRILSLPRQIQRFGGGEHKSLGDNATGSQTVNLGGEIFHDWDNEKGVVIKGGGRIYGDNFQDTNASDEEELVVKIFETALQPSARRSIRGSKVTLGPVTGSRAISRTTRSTAPSARSVVSRCGP